MFLKRKKNIVCMIKLQIDTIFQLGGKYRTGIVEVLALSEVYIYCLVFKPVLQGVKSWFFMVAN